MNFLFSVDARVPEALLGPVLRMIHFGGGEVIKTEPMAELQAHIVKTNGGPSAGTAISSTKTKPTGGKPLTTILREFVEKTPSGAEITSSQLRAAADHGGGNPSNIFSVLPALIKAKLIKKVEKGVYKKV